MTNVYKNNLKLQLTLDTIEKSEYVDLALSLGLRKDAITKRLQQILLHQLVGIFDRHPDFNHEKIRFKNDKISFSKESKHLRITPSFSHLLSLVGLYLFNIFRYTLYFFLSKKDVPGIYSVVELWGFEKQVLQDIQFEENFFTAGPISEIHDTQIILGQPHDHRDNGIIISRNPLKTLARLECRGKIKAFHFFIQNISLFFKLFWASLRNPEIFLLFPDFSYLYLVQYFDQSGILKNYLSSNSTLEAQSLAAFGLEKRKFKNIMFFYSINSKEFKLKSAKNYVDLPHSRYIAADLAYCWNSENVEWVKAMNSKIETKIIGASMPWLNRYKSKIPTDHFVITLFDSPPLLKSVLKRVLGREEYYYSKDTSINFVQDIIAVTEELEKETGSRIELRLKSKRKNPNLEPEYFNFLDSNTRLKLWHHEDDLYEVMAHSHLCLCIPFTSVGYIASSVEKMSIYYDPTNSLEMNFKLDPGMSFVSTKTSLKEEIKNKLLI